MASSIPVKGPSKHALSPSDEAAFRARVPKGTTSIEIRETKHIDVVEHRLQFLYTTPKGRFLFCKVSGGSFSDLLEQLKTCPNQATKI